MVVSSRLVIGTLFKGTMFSFGLAFFVFGFFMAQVFVGDIDWRTLKLSTDSPITRAEIVDIAGTGFYVNDVEVISYSYVFKHPDDPLADVNWRSYNTGYADLALGDSVDVQYVPIDAYVSRIVGMTDSQMGGGGVLFVLLFPGVGLLVMVGAWRKNQKAIRVLRNGIPAYGRLMHTEPTGVTLNDKPQYRLTFAFSTDDGQVKEGTIKSVHLDKLTDDEEELLLYDSDRPSRIVLVDSLPVGSRRYVLNQLKM